MPDVTGKIVATRRLGLGLSHRDVARELKKRGDKATIETLIRWLERIEEAPTYRGRTSSTRPRYRQLIEILGLAQDEPAFEILASEVEGLGDRLEALRTLMLRVLDRLDGTKLR